MFRFKLPPQRLPTCHPIHATFLISIMLLREVGAGLPTALCRLEPIKYALVKAALALNLRAGSYISIFYKSAKYGRVRL